MHDKTNKLHNKTTNVKIKEKGMRGRLKREKL
jgi:hypothetical protein